jgi:hypothetical protein
MNDRSNTAQLMNDIGLEKLRRRQLMFLGEVIISIKILIKPLPYLGRFHFHDASQHPRRGLVEGAVVYVLGTGTVTELCRKGLFITL